MYPYPQNLFGTIDPCAKKKNHPVYNYPKILEITDRK